jgi:hypothetical protein
LSCLRSHLLVLSAALLWLCPAPLRAEEPADAGSSQPAKRHKKSHHPARTQAMADAEGEAFGDEADLDTTIIRTLTQVRYRNTWPVQSQLTRDPGIRQEQLATAEVQDGYEIHRAFLRFISRPIRPVQTVLLLDFAELLRKKQQHALKYAYAKIDVTRQVQLEVGLFKRTFSLLELLPIADYELAEMGPTDDFAKQLGYAGRDVGVMVKVSPLPSKRQLSVFLGAYGGDLQEGYDASPIKVVTARLESKPWKFLRLGTDAAFRTDSSVVVQSHTVGTDKIFTEDMALYRGMAASSDVTLHLGGFELRTEGMLGRRTDPWRALARNFAAAWAVAAYRFRVGKVAVMPAVRAEWLDVDRDRPVGARYYYSAGLNVEPLRPLRVLVDFSYYSVDRGTYSLTEVPWLSTGTNQRRPLDVNWTALTVQVQLEI